jgi:hypothetical protein
MGRENLKAQLRFKVVNNQTSCQLLEIENDGDERRKEEQKESYFLIPIFSR